MSHCFKKEFRFNFLMPGGGSPVEIVIPAGCEKLEITHLNGMTFTFEPFYSVSPDVETEGVEFKYTCDSGEYHFWTKVYHTNGFGDRIPDSDPRDPVDVTPHIDSSGKIVDVLVWWRWNDRKPWN